MTPAEQAIHFEVRLSVAEYFISKLAAATFASEGWTLERFDKERAATEAKAGEKIFAMSDPALSDHVAAEWAEAMRSHLDGQRGILAQMLAG